MLSKYLIHGLIMLACFFGPISAGIGGRMPSLVVATVIVAVLGSVMVLRQDRSFPKRSPIVDGLVLLWVAVGNMMLWSVAIEYIPLEKIPMRGVLISPRLDFYLLCFIVAIGGFYRLTAGVGRKNEH